MEEELKAKIQNIEKQILALERIAHTTREAYALDAAYETILILKEYREELGNRLSTIMQKESENNPVYNSNAALFH